MAIAEKIAVLGAGVMGTGIAMNLAAFGYEVILKDIDENILLSAREKISKDLRMLKMMRPDYKELELDQLLSRIAFNQSYQDFEELDFVIENVSEKWETKEKLYKELREVCKNEAIFCVNTSCISITKIGALMSHPENIIGMHFMNPVPLKEMVELVKGYHTSTETIDKAKAFLKSIKKSPVLVNDYPGFVANRLSHLFMNEAAFLIQDQVASPKDVDMIFKKGYGHSMGPLETADLIGLDTVVDSLEILYQNYQDSKFRCCPLLRKMVDAGLLGKKSGEGFYKY